MPLQAGRKPTPFLLYSQSATNRQFCILAGDRELFPDAGYVNDGMMCAWAAPDVHRAIDRCQRAFRYRRDRRRRLLVVSVLPFAST